MLGNANISYIPRSEIERRSWGIGDGVDFE